MKQLPLATEMLMFQVTKHSLRKDLCHDYAQKARKRIVALAVYRAQAHQAVSILSEHNLDSIPWLSPLITIFCKHE